MTVKDTSGRFWIHWTLATIAGTATAYGVNSGLMTIIEGPLLVFIVCGVCIGGFQAFALRGKLRSAKAWIVASVVGWFLVGVVFLITSSFLISYLYTSDLPHASVRSEDAEVTGGLLALGLSLLLSGGVVGLVQLVPLRLQLSQSKGWWWSSTLSWGIGIGTWFGALTLSHAHPIWCTVGFILAGTIVGVSTGRVMNNLLL
jgi:hypothetical protein